MLASLQIQNFKSYEDATLYFTPLTFFVGANASGKSNALEALRLLNWLAGGMRLEDIEQAIKKDDSYIRGNIRDLFKDIAKPITFTCHLPQSEESNWNILTLKIGYKKDRLVFEEEKISNDAGLSLYHTENKHPSATFYGYPDLVSVSCNNLDSKKTRTSILCSNQRPAFYQFESPSLFHNDDKNSQFIIIAISRIFRMNLRNIFFLYPNTNTMRGYATSGDHQIKEDGSNLSSVLSTICKNSDVKRNLLEIIRSIPEQDIKDISFIKNDRNDVMLRIHEFFGKNNKKIDVPLLSDGTLRVLCIGAMLLSADKKSLIIIEEMDNGIHPSRVKSLLQKISEIALKRSLQILISTHNPALLDAVDDAELKNVICCYRDSEQGDSRITRLTDIRRFPELMAQDSLGQLVTNQKQDFFLKDKRSEEEYMASVLAWLKELREATKDGYLPH